MMSELLIPGDCIAIRANAPWYSPKSIVYWGIDHYEKKKYPPTLWQSRPIVNLKHMVIVTGPRKYFEMAVPWGRYRTFAQGNLLGEFDRGNLIVTRFVNTRLDLRGLAARCDHWEGMLYDLTDLFNFAVSGWVFGIYSKMIVWWGPDKFNIFRTCAATVADILVHAGVPLPVNTGSVDPAAFINCFGLNPGLCQESLWYPKDITHLLTRESFI